MIKNEGFERVEKLNALIALRWTEEEKEMLRHAFALVNKVMFKCSEKKEHKKVNELYKARWELHELATAFGLESLIESLPTEVKYGQH